MINLYNTDCMEFMRTVPDKAYDLAIVDPEYGADIKGPCGRLQRYGGLKSVNSNPPNKKYFDELHRISKKSIIWGANYFNLSPCKCFIIWDKEQPETASYAQVEYAWTNLEGTAKIFRKRVINADVYRIHPTQKPVALYKWLLTNYAKQGDKILDTHGGSMSIAIACHDLGFSLDLCEIDKEYFDAGKLRLERHQQQQMLNFGAV